jgi:hypothetical protein
MRGVLAAGAVVVLIGSGGSYALLSGSAANKAPATPAAVEAPHLETARLFAEPASAPPASDLISLKLAAPPTAWPDVPKLPVTPKMQQPTKTAAAAKAKIHAKAKSTANPKPNKPATDTTMARR